MLRIMVEKKELKKMVKECKNEETSYGLIIDGKEVFVNPVVSVWIDKEGNLYVDTEGKQIKI